MQAFFQDALAVAVLGSGSRGNATYIGDGHNGVLVDCGLSTRQILQRMEAVGLGGAPIDAVLITHEHTDHVGAARILDNRLSRDREHPLPFYMTTGTARGLPRRVAPRRIERVKAGVFSVGKLQIEACSVPHDTDEPVCFTVQSGATRAGVITDLGRTTRAVARQLASLDLAILEFNHDLTMLLEGPYPWPLKQRIRGSRGHLSNAQAAELLAQGVSARLQRIVLAHLSEENNHPLRALQAADEALCRAGRRGVALEVAQQDAPIDPIGVTSAPRPEPVGGVHPPSPTNQQMDLFGVSSGK